MSKELDRLNKVINDLDEQLDKPENNCNNYHHKIHSKVIVNVEFELKNYKKLLLQQKKKDELLGLYQTIYELEINGMLDGFYIEDVDDRANQNDLLLEKIKVLDTELKNVINY